MNKWKRIIFLIFIEVFLVSFHVLAKQNYLVMIGNEKYTAKDFKWWWEHWSNPGQPLIENIDPYVKWLLFLKEAEKMRLEEDPIYHKRLMFFLKPRVLLRLQYDEVESKIKITEKDLKDFYYKEFSPIFFIKTFYFTKEEDALKFRKKIKSIENCKKVFEKYKNTKISSKVRPWNLPENMREVFCKLRKPQIIGPLKCKKMWKVICVEKIEKGNEKDCEKIKNGLKEVFKKEKRNELTDKLISALKKKYKIVLNEDLLKKITLEEPSEDIKDKILLQIEDRFLTVENFYKILSKEAKLRHKIINKNDPKSIEKFKRFVINSIIAQNLIDIEALNRGYEKKEPLKSQYEFYKKDLLVRGFIDYIIVPNIKITEDEIREYYERYKKDYDITETVTAIIVKTREEPLIRKIERERKKGKSLESILKELGFEDFIVKKDINKFSSEIKNILNSMKPGEIKKIKINGKFYLIKVIDKEVNRGYTYEKLKPHIKQILEEEKYKEEENKIYKLLKKEYNVKINYKEWEKLKKELSQKEHKNG
ncbi:hypothetical protein DRN73_05705 [Candidatus Pacearchaeota archaeon]|nr:MAG: hypothetical protein DRN73_05705 [Candidatus Pacearchaeota archaeon]